VRCVLPDMTRTKLIQVVALLAMIALFGAACAGSSDNGGDTAASDPDDSELFDSGGDDPSSPDAEDLFTDEPVDQDAGDDGAVLDREAPESDQSAETEQPAEEEAAFDSVEAAPQASLEVGGDSADDEGIFAPEPEPRDAEADRLEANTFEDYGLREFIEVADDPFSTFALDVDTGSYTVGRRWLDEGVLPPPDSVRPEEYINAFDYDYDEPRSGLEITVDGAPSPFDEDNHLVRIGVQGEIVDDDDRQDAALTFIVDTSGSMDRDDRLGLVKESLEILVNRLEDDDTVAIVIYNDGSGVVLPPTPISEADTILDAIDDLRPGGSTNLEAGLREGYALAREAFREGGINRVIIASDGVANAGVTDPDDLARMIREDADAGIELVTIGFGMGNFNDVIMEQLADQGDGFYAYVDTDDEAERLFEDELTSTLVTIAKDAKIQVEFEEDLVREYRLIGFENRGVLDSEFRNDDVDAGEIGSGHQVTAIYEVELERGVDIDDRGELGVVMLRWEDPSGGNVIEIDEDIDLRDIEPDWADTDTSLQLATVVAAYAEILRNSPYADGIDLDDVAVEADRLADETNDRDVAELADLIALASDLS